MTDQNPTGISKLTIIAFGILIAAVAGIVLLGVLGLIEAPMAPRLMGIVFGLLMIITGNVLPKIVNPVDSQSRLGRRQRAVGWILVLTGATLVVALPFLSNANVALAGLVVGSGGLALAGAFILEARWQDRNSAAPHLDLTHDDLARVKHVALLRTSAFDILHGFAWAFIFPFTAVQWGKDGFMWTVIAFAASMAIFSSRTKSGAASRC